MGRIALIDGRIVDSEEKILEMEDRGYQFGDGVYEVTRIYNGRPFGFRWHMDRLNRSLAELRIPATYSFAELTEFHDRLIKESRLQESTIYLQITRGVAPRDHSFPRQVAPRLTMTIQPITRNVAMLEAGTAGIFLPDERWLRCDIKSINLLPNLLARQKAVEAGAYEAILVRPASPTALEVTPDGIVTEGSRSNFFVVKDGALWSHPVNNLILEGISRRVIVDRVLPKVGVTLNQRPFSVAFAKSADEAFIASTSTEVMPLVRLDGVAVGSGKPGPVTRRILDAFLAAVAEECGTTAGTTA